MYSEPSDDERIELYCFCMPMTYEPVSWWWLVQYCQVDVAFQMVSPVSSECSEANLGRLSWID